MKHRIMIMVPAHYCLGVTIASLGLTIEQLPEVVNMKKKEALVL